MKNLNKITTTNQYWWRYTLKIVYLNLYC